MVMMKSPKQVQGQGGQHSFGTMLCFVFAVVAVEFSWPERAGIRVEKLEAIFLTPTT